jgi:hypothetical protein
VICAARSDVVGTGPDIAHSVRLGRKDLPFHRLRVVPENFCNVQFGLSGFIRTGCKHFPTFLKALDSPSTGRMRWELSNTRYMGFVMQARLRCG